MYVRSHNPDISECVCVSLPTVLIYWSFFFQAEDGIRDLVRSRGLGDVYKRQLLHYLVRNAGRILSHDQVLDNVWGYGYDGYANQIAVYMRCLLYTSDAADERSSVDLGGRRIIKKKNIGRSQQ